MVVKMKYTKPSYCILTVLVMLAMVVSASGKEQDSVPGQVYQALEYLFNLSQSEDDLDPEKLSALINFVQTVPVESGMILEERRGAVGAFHAFSVEGNLSRVLDYAYSPDIPIYVTMPSSVQDHKWLTPEVDNHLRSLARNVESTIDIRLLRGRDREVITPDTNTGGYYTYTQDRLVTILPGPSGPVLVSASIQVDPSDVGRKGCVVGDDKNWNYLYSDETGLSTTGLGWVDSYMYHADSVIVYVADSSRNVLHVGSFKWLNGGWAKINMVKAHHILNGIKRFASDFKAVLESPGLPDAQVVADKYRELLQATEQELRRLVSRYLQALNGSGNLDVCPSPLESLVSSGEYLEQMTRAEMVRVLLLEFFKEYLGKEPLIRIASQPGQTATITSRP